MNVFDDPDSDEEGTSTEELNIDGDRGLFGDDFYSILYEALGNLKFRFSTREFQRWEVLNEEKIDSFSIWDVIGIVLFFARPFFQHLLTCTNVIGCNKITLKDLFLCHALLRLTTYMRLDRVGDYYKLREFFTIKGDAAEIKAHLSMHRYN
jgi:hypothetical protein